jgi:hypothetical protein
MSEATTIEGTKERERERFVTNMEEDGDGRAID